MNTKTNLCLAGCVLVCVASVGIFAVSFASVSQADRQAGAKPNGNSKCYVCHRSLKTEDITTVHLEAGITCDECHGQSVEHLQDEMLMTKPDLLFGRLEVDKMCSNPTCHRPGGERYAYGFKDHIDTAAVKAFHKKWLGRIRPNGRAITAKSICTDCHGTHNIVTKTGTQSKEKQLGEWIAVFNGQDLSGWRPSGGASWTVNRGRIIATIGPKGKGGDLWTEALYEDYLLAVTFRAEWPIHAGIWLRSTDSDDSPRVEIFERSKPTAFTGSVWVSGKGPALVNLREELVDREGWNTISVEVRGDRFQVWLNGEEVGVVHIPGPEKGRIGLHIEKHPMSKAVELCVREVLIKRLDKAGENMSTSSRN